MDFYQVMNSPNPSPCWTEFLNIVDSWNISSITARIDEIIYIYCSNGIYNCVPCYFAPSQW